MNSQNLFENVDPSNWKSVEDSLECLKDSILWNEMGLRNDIPEWFLLKYWRRFENANYPFVNPLPVPKERYSEDFARKFLNTEFQQRYSYVIKNCSLGLKFIEEELMPKIKETFKGETNSIDYLKILICSNQFLTEELIRKILGRNIRKFLTAILKYQQVNERFLNYYKKYFTEDHWETIFLVQNYSLNFLKKNYTRVSGTILKTGIGWYRLFFEIPNEIKLYAEIKR